jgi:hypothetical protein
MITILISCKYKKSNRLNGLVRLIFCQYFIRFCVFEIFLLLLQPKF